MGRFTQGRRAALALSAACALLLLPSVSAAHTATPSILGGGDAPSGSWPYIARIVIGGQYLCTGTVVAPNVVLTAGHCTVDTSTMITNDPSEYQVMTGSLSATSGGQVSGVSQVIPYPYFTNYSGSNGEFSDRDLGLLQLSTPTSSPSVQVANSNDAYLYDPGTGSEIAGWGVDDSYGDVAANLQSASTVVQNASYCQDVANSYFGDPYDSAAEMCVIDAPYNNDSACPGDSGGPLIAFDSSNNPVEIGLTSWGSVPCNTSLPQYYTNLLTFSSWISTEIQKLSPPVVQTGSASNITQTAVTFNGSVNPNGTPTSYYFQYGSTVNLGQTTPSGSASNGVTALPVSEQLTNLSPGETVYYRLVATSANGASTGQTESTTTSSPAPPPLPEWGTYRGSGPQVRPIHFYVEQNGTQIKHLVFGFTVSCTRHRRRIGYQMAPSGAFRLNTHQGLGITTRFRDQEGWRYTFTGLFTTKGRASGTVSVIGHDPKLGLCRSGQERWTAH